MIVEITFWIAVVGLTESLLSCVLDQAMFFADLI
jgi:hypothetical protein